MDQLVRTEVVPERHAWAVFLLVIDRDGVERRWISSHRTEREATLAAARVQRTAQRRPPPERPA
jgi:hypothetical protein